MHHTVCLLLPNGMLWAERTQPCCTGVLVLAAEARGRVSEVVIGMYHIGKPGRVGKHVSRGRESPVKGQGGAVWQGKACTTPLGWADTMAGRDHGGQRPCGETTWRGKHALAKFLLQQSLAALLVLLRAPLAHHTIASILSRMSSCGPQVALSPRLQDESNDAVSLAAAFVNTRVTSRKWLVLGYGRGCDECNKC